MPVPLISLAAAGGLLVFALLVILGISAWVVWNYTWVYRFPVWGHPRNLGLAFEDVEFRSRHDRLKLKGWYLPAGSDDRCIILVQGEEHHRNSPGIRQLELARDLVRRGFSVLLFDLRGRGESEGRRGSAGDREQWDVLGAIDYVNSRGIATERIGLVGFSLGAAVAILVAAREPRIPAIVADSAFADYLTSLRRVPFYWLFLPRWFALPIVLVGSAFFGADFANVRPIKALPRVAPRPILFVHGGSDSVISHRETLELYNASAGPANQVWIVPGVGHVRAYASRPQEYADRVARFFGQYLR